jgi:arsenate reductase
MAEGFMRELAPEGIEVWSAGIAPIGLDRRAVAVMREIGIDISGHGSKGVESVPLDRVDLIVTLCSDAEPCPRTPKPAKVLHWPLPDPYLSPPKGQDGLDVFREIRDELKKRIVALLDEGE